MTEYGLLYDAHLRRACAGRVCGAWVCAVGVRWACGGWAGRAACAVQQEQCAQRAQRCAACAACAAPAGLAVVVLVELLGLVHLVVPHVLVHEGRSLSSSPSGTPDPASRGLGAGVQAQVRAQACLAGGAPQLLVLAGEEALSGPAASVVKRENRLTDCQSNAETRREDLRQCRERPGRIRGHGRSGCSVHAAARPPAR